MVGIIILLVVIIIASLVLLVTISNKISSQQEVVESLKDSIHRLSEQLSKLTPLQNEDPKQERIYKPLAPLAPEPPVRSEEIAIKQETKPIQNIPKPVTPPEEPVIEQAPWQPAWIQKNSDLEKFIGENLANKIGIAVLVLGIAFFVKYAIDKNWINETGRVVIGLFSGCVLIGFAHYIRNSYRSFSSVLVGGGLTVFYFTIAFAFHQYHLLSQDASFIIMVVITAFAVALSVLYDRMELAILAAVGGFITPFLVSTGTDNYIALFTYLCILNSGLMVLAWFKRWPAINTIALFFTVIIFGSWLLNRVVFIREINFPFKQALLFAGLFYAQLVIMNIVNNLKLKYRFNAFSFIIVLTINFLYFGAGIVILQFWNDGNYKGLFTASLGLINFVLAWLFFRNKKIDANFVFLLIGLTLTFTSLVAPIQLKGNYITLFWAAETVVLFWLYQKSRIVILKIASLCIAIVTIISLMMDWSQIYFSGTKIIPVIINKGFTTTIFTAVSFFIYWSLMRKEADSFYLREVTNRQIRNLFLISATLVTYLAGVLEIYYQFQTRYPEMPLFVIYLQLYSFTFVSVLLFTFIRSTALPLLRLLLTILSLTLYLIGLKQTSAISVGMLNTGHNQIHFLAHWIAVAILIKLLYDLIALFRKNNIEWASYETAFTWIMAGSLLLLLSVEIYYATLWINHERQMDWDYWQNLYYKAGLSIVWSICSFVMMWLGMKNRFRTLRIISLSLFSVTLVKLFFYDISNIPPGGKIAAFVMLGILLLTVSFMYQRLKKIIIEDVSQKN